MREEVEMLEDHADLLTAFVDIGLLVRDIHALEINVALGGHFEKIQ